MVTGGEVHYLLRPRRPACHVHDEVAVVDAVFPFIQHYEGVGGAWSNKVGVLAEYAPTGAAIAPTRTAHPVVD